MKFLKALSTMFPSEPLLCCDVSKSICHCIFSVEHIDSSKIFVILDLSPLLFKLCVMLVTA